MRCLARSERLKHLPQDDVRRQDVELIVPVLGPRFRIVRGIERPLLAVGKGFDAGRSDPMRHEVLLGARLRAEVSDAYFCEQGGFYELEDHGERQEVQGIHG